MWYKSIGHPQLYKKGNVVSINNFEREYGLVVKGLNWILRFWRSWILILPKPLHSLIKTFADIFIFSSQNDESDLQQYWSFKKTIKIHRTVEENWKSQRRQNMCYFKYSARLIAHVQDLMFLVCSSHWTLFNSKFPFLYKIFLLYWGKDLFGFQWPAIL